jgi:hypothetical protein
MTPREFLDQIAKPNLEEAMQNINDIRIAFNACAAVTALASHLFEYLKDNGLTRFARDGEFKTKFLSQHSEQFRIVHDIAEAHKHARLVRTTLVDSSDALRSEIKDAGYQRWNELLWDGTEAICVRVNGEQRVVIALVLHAIQFLDNEIWLAEQEAELRSPKSIDDWILGNDARGPLEEP